MNQLPGKQSFAAHHPADVTPQDNASGDNAGEDGTRAPRRGRKRWIGLLALIVLGAGGYFAWSQAAPDPAPGPIPAAAPAERIMRLNGFDVTTVAAGGQEETVRLTGTLAPARQAVVSARTGGRIEEVLVQPGDSVAQGAVIARIDTEELALQYAQQESSVEATRIQFELAESQLASTRSLVERGASPRSALDSAQSNVDGLAANLSAQRSQLATLALNLEQATIRAPFAGTIAERSAEPGQSVNPGAAIATVVDTSRVEVRGAISLTDASRVAVGQAVRIEVEGRRDAVREGTIDRINPVAIEGTRSLPIYLSLDNADGALRGGMFVTGQVVISEAHDVFALPAGAIREDGEGTHVLVLAEDRLERRAVTTGQAWQNGRMVSITEGLSEGDEVVSQALAELTPGMRVALEGR